MASCALSLGGAAAAVGATPRGRAGAGRRHGVTVPLRSRGARVAAAAGGPHVALTLAEEAPPHSAVLEAAPVLTLPLSSKGLGVERNKPLPDVPKQNVHWVCDAAGVARCYEAVLNPSHNPSTSEGYPPVVGPGRYCSPRHRLPFNSRIGGSKCGG